jgi:hypothetical protein
MQHFASFFFLKFKSYLLVKRVLLRLISTSAVSLFSVTMDTDISINTAPSTAFITAVFPVSAHNDILTSISTQQQVLVTYACMYVYQDGSCK